MDKSYSDQSYDLVKWGMLGMIGGGIIVMIVLSALVRDTAYIRKYPAYFIAEVVAMGIGGALPLLFVAYCRGTAIESTLIEFCLLAAKFALLHVGLQLSGVYTHIFGATTRHGLFLKSHSA